jgi:Big-like domain-containing protein
VLGNDSDPDGDPITARVQSTSFAAKEWSGLRADGSFSYAAGAGVRRVLHKTITYIAVDAYGAVSAPAHAVVTVDPDYDPPGKAKSVDKSCKAVKIASGFAHWTPYIPITGVGPVG